MLTVRPLVTVSYATEAAAGVSPSLTVTIWVAGVGAYAVPPNETFDATRAYPPGARLEMVCEVVSERANPPGPDTDTAADAPPGSPETATARLPVTGPLGSPPPPPHATRAVTRSRGVGRNHEPGRFMADPGLRNSPYR